MFAFLGGRMKFAACLKERKKKLIYIYDIQKETKPCYSRSQRYAHRTQYEIHKGYPSAPSPLIERPTSAIVWWKKQLTWEHSISYSPNISLRSENINANGQGLSSSTLDTLWTQWITSKPCRDSLRQSAVSWLFRLIPTHHVEEIALIRHSRGSTLLFQVVTHQSISYTLYCVDG